MCLSPSELDFRIPGSIRSLSLSSICTFKYYPLLFFLFFFTLTPAI